MSRSAQQPSSGARSSDLVGGGLIILMALQFGSVVVLGKLLINSHLPVASLLSLRFLIAAGLLTTTLAAMRQSLRAAPGEGWRLGVLGMAGYALESGLFFAALAHGTAPAVTLLFFTYPVWVALIAIARGRGLPGPLVVGALVAAVSGAAVVVVTGGGVDIDGTGVLLALGAAVTFSLYLTGADAVLSRTNSLVGAMWVSVAAGTGLLAYSLASASAQWPRGWHQWGPVLGMAAFTAGAFVMLFAGLRRLGAIRTSVISAMEPLAASVLAVIFLGDSIRAGVVFGGVLILAGAVAASLARKESLAEPPVP
jgi:drug/metabolite transporter (DMT)-like permease